MTNIDHKHIFHLLNGAFDNFQQAWQENTEEDIHRVSVEQKHKHLHLTFEQQISIPREAATVFKILVKEGRINQQIIAQFCLELNNTVCKFYQLISNEHVKKEQRNIEEIIWHKDGPIIIGTSKNGNTKIEILNNQLIINQINGFFANPIPYKFLKCRFFSGWIEYPNPKNPDEIFRMGNLKMHDQGAMIPLTFKDGSKGPYTVELTQLIFAKQLAIMKLAIYEQPFETIDYNSKAISYTWTNPDAKRIGINLRKVLSGWTFMEPGYINSDNTNWEEDNRLNSE